MYTLLLRHYCWLKYANVYKEYCSHPPGSRNKEALE